MTAIAEFNIIGIEIRTTNEDNQAAIDIPKLWDRFLSEEIAARIPNKTDDAVYCIYTDYEKDYTKPYTTILGCKVDHLDKIPAGLTGWHVEGGHYKTFTAKGKITAGIVFQEWTKIWNSGMDRVYTADFEIYDERAQDPDHAEVDIFIAVK